MNEATHKITREIDMRSVPRAVPLWHDSLTGIVETLRASGDLTVRGAIVLLEKLGVAGRRTT